MKCMIVAAVGMLLSSSAQAQALPPERVFASPPISGPVARGVALSPDGKSVTYIKTKADDLQVTDLWIADVAGGAPRMLIDGRKLAPAPKELSEAEKARRERAGVSTRGVTAYEWDEQGRYILAPVEGDVFLYSRADDRLTQLTNTPEDEIDPKVSPKGRFVSYVRDFNLYVKPVAGGAERAITTDGKDVKFWALADFLADEELDRQTGYWWSPDESKIALTFVDETGVDVVPRPDVGATGATMVEQRYPRPGRPNPVTELYVADMASGARTKVDLGGGDFYVARVDWARDSNRLYVQRLTRDQKRLDLLAVDPASGRARVILSETSPAWVELSNDFRALRGGDFLWTSERSGYRHIFLVDATGKTIRQVTKGAWPVQRISGIDEAKELVLFSARKDKPIEQRLYAVSWARPAEPKAVTPAGGVWSATVAKTGGAFVASYSDPKTPPRTALYRADGTRARWIEENALKDGHPFWPYVARLRTPTFGTLKAADGQDLWWSMRTPVGFDASKRYPVIVQTYGGPQSSMVANDWANPEDQLLLDAGYILFRLDNRGSSNRSVAFKTAIKGALGLAAVEDQVAGARYLQTLPYVDPTKIGVTGNSFGGFMTLMLLSERNTPFAAGVAQASVSDWSLYDSAYAERYMGTPQNNPQGYAATDVLNRLSELKPGALLIIHGMADDNVTFDQATRVLHALQNKGVAFETMVYPGVRHRSGATPTTRMHRSAMVRAFFDRKLSPAALRPPGAVAP